MLKALRYATGFGVAALVMQFAILGTSGNGVSELSLEEASSVWGAGYECCVTYAEYDADGNPVYGCTGTGCTPVQNFAGCDYPGDSKLLTWTCYYYDAFGNQITCGSATVSTTCDQAA